jgi:alanine dehydrogenase
MEQSTLLLGHTEILELLSFDEYISSATEAFRLRGLGKSLATQAMHVEAAHGEFHVKAGGLELEKWYFGLKVNGGFFDNPKRFGIPSIRGAILLFDADSGMLLSIMDSYQITTTRTGAVTALAARYLAKPTSRVATICGCGVQGRIQLEFLAHVLPLETAHVFARDITKARAFAEVMSRDLAVNVKATEDLKGALQKSDVCVTCTPARAHFVNQDDVPPGMFIAAIGADSPEKRELDPSLLIKNTVVVDILEQCARVGELHHAIDTGMRSEDVHAELAEVVNGRKPGRRSDGEIVIFDATGTALVDVAVAAAVYDKARKEGKGARFNFTKVAA